MTTKRSWTADAPLVIAHRGASLLAPENTMAAFRLAAELGADAVEFDVKLTRDGVAVIHHDMSLGRTTDGVGRIKDINSTKLFRLDAGLKFGEKFRGEPIPTLEQVLIEFKDQILLNIELTNYTSPIDTLPQTVLSNLNYANLTDNILISSFNLIALRKINRLNPKIRTALLVGTGIPGWIRRPLENLTPYDDLHPHYNLITKQLVQRIHLSENRINTWTVNDYDLMVELMSIGVDGIITDDVRSGIRAREACLLP